VGWLSMLAVICAGIMVAVAFVLRSMRVGRRFVAAGANRTRGQGDGHLAHVNELCAYVVAAVLYGVAGMLLAGQLISPDYTLGDPYQLATIVAVALGGATFVGGPASVSAPRQGVSSRRCSTSTWRSAGCPRGSRY